MREIKFRAWDKEENKMMDMDELVCPTDWEERSYLVQAMDGVITNLILIQYTNLKDKNGVEIYEGDIIQMKDMFKKRYEVIFKDGAFGFQWHIFKNLNFWHTSWFEVIGNIYESKNLLDK